MKDFRTGHVAHIAVPSPGCCWPVARWGQISKRPAAPAPIGDCTGRPLTGYRRHHEYLRRREVNGSPKAAISPATGGRSFIPRPLNEPDRTVALRTMPTSKAGTGRRYPWRGKMSWRNGAYIFPARTREAFSATTPETTQDRRSRPRPTFRSNAAGISIQSVHAAGQRFLHARCLRREPLRSAGVA